MTKDSKELHATHATIKIIDDYYPTLPPNSPIKLVILRGMLQKLEEMEAGYKICKTAVKMPEPETIVVYNNQFKQLKKSIRELAGL